MDSSEQDGRKGETITLPARDLRVIVRDGEEYTPEAIEQRSIVIYPLDDLAAAIAAERERCAKIAEAHSGCPVGGCDGKDCGMDIAAKIRSGE